MGRSRPITYVQNWINYVLNRIGPAPIIITSLWMLNAWQSARNSMAYLFGAGNNSKWPLPCQVTTGPVDICWNKVVMACRHMVRSCALWDQTKGIYLFQFYSHTKYNRFSAKKKLIHHRKTVIAEIVYYSTCHYSQRWSLQHEPKASISHSTCQKHTILFLRLSIRVSVPMKENM